MCVLTRWCEPSMRAVLVRSSGLTLTVIAHAARALPLLSRRPGHHAMGADGWARPESGRHALVAVGTRGAHRMRVAVGGDPVDQIRLGEQCPGHRDELEALRHREVH